MAVAVLNTYNVYDLNSLDAYTLCTVHEQEPVVARHEITNYMRAIACVLLMSISRNFSSNSHASVKFKLSCTVEYQLVT